MNRKHDTEGVRKHAVDTSLWWEFKPGQRVRTNEGLLGTVTAVEDGPFAGNEHYLVELDGGMGGGEYSSSELMATTERTASKQSAELHVASDDYPVLSDILEKRLPLENVQQKWAAQTEDFSEEVRSAPPVPADFSTYEKQDTDRRWEDPQYYDKAYQASVGNDLNEHVGFFRTKPGSGRSYDWCRFRRQQHCFYPKQLNEAATKIEGVPVWVPEDRGICGRHDWDEQRACPVSEPGPRSREALYYPDATVPYEAGGQRRDDPRAFHTNYKAPLTNFNLITNITTSMKDPDFSMHYTGAWVDVMNKARYLRQSGNVFIFSAPEQGTGNTDFIVGEVLGDSGIPYRVRLMREPGARRIAMWECGCAWGHYAWGRSGRWKKFEGRMCSHALSLLYEVQGREGFGGDRQIWENTEVPIWRDADEEPQERHPVTDDSYRDWRVGSLEMPEGTDFGMEREGNWRPVEWNDDFEHAPIVLMSAHEVMSAEANKNASRGGFPVKWRGQTEWVVQMDTDSSSVVLSNGAETNCFEVLHPRYHPTLGLNPSESGDYEPMLKGARKTVAERSGFPEVDAVIEDFLDERIDGLGTRVRDMTAAEAHGYCEVVSEQFVEFAQARGLRAYVTHTDLDEMGYEIAGAPQGEVLDDDGNIVMGHYSTHTVASIYLSGTVVPIIVDFSAKQYGYSAHPKISKLKDEPEPALPRTEGEEDDDFLFEAEKPRPMEMLDMPDEPDDTPPPPEPTPEDDEEDEEPEDTMQLEASALPRPEWLMSGGGSRKSSGRDGGISNSDIAAQARKVLAAKTFSPEEQADLIGEGEGTVAARNLDRLDITGTHYEALERIDAEEEEGNYDNLWGMML